MTEQIAVRIPLELATGLEELVSEGRFETKADAIRAAIRALVDQERRHQIGERIAEGYRRVPQTDDEVAAAAAAAIRSIHEEPW
jgi:Arc/MetJ-type ribon-helix-helix transcriptional regulator